MDLGHRAGLPVVVKVVGSDIAELPKFPARRKQTVETLKKADWVIAVSQDLAKKVIAMGANPSRVTALHHGIDWRGVLMLP